MKLTEDRLKELAYSSGLEPCDSDPVYDGLMIGEVVSMAKELLASREQSKVKSDKKIRVNRLNYSHPSLKTWTYIVETELRLQKGDLLYTHPEKESGAIEQDYFSYLVLRARDSASKAMVKFPQPNYVLSKVSEEHGEVIKGVIHYLEGRETWENVEGELIDNLAMLIRLVVEGDQVIGFTPPESTKI